MEATPGRMAELTGEMLTLALLVAIAFLSGIGITTIGPGGVFVTVALYALTSVSSSAVAGTAHLTFIGTGIVASVAYARSGELQSVEARRMAVVLAPSSVLGALVGAYVNAFVPRALFGLLLGVVVIVVGANIVYRDRRGHSPVYHLDVTLWEGRVGLGSLGVGLGTVSGLSGVGGPVFAVPALVLLGVPMLLGVAVAQVQSVFIAAFAAAGYLLQGAVLFPLAVAIGLSLLAGVVVGWKVAHRVDPAELKVALGVALVAVGGYLTP